MAQGNSRWVLRDVNLAIPPLRSVGVIGANGAGKSTLLRLLGGMDSATSGEVVRTSRVSWPLGLGGGLQGSLTGRQNAKFVCRLHGQEQAMQSVLSEISAFSELGPSFDEPVRTYSSGMQARLKFAMSLAFRFDVYLVDELTAVGDAAFKRKSRQAFQRLASESSVIMVSHDERTLKEFCVSGILVQEGSAVWFDNLDDALAHYKGATAK